MGARKWLSLSATLVLSLSSFSIAQQRSPINLQSLDDIAKILKDGGKFIEGIFTKHKSTDFENVKGKFYVLLPIIVDPKETGRVTNNFHTNWNGDRILVLHVVNIPDDMRQSMTLELMGDLTLKGDKHYWVKNVNDEQRFGGGIYDLYFSTNVNHDALAKLDHPAILLIEKGLELKDVQASLAERSKE